ncbi:hypothetical protein ISP15_10955 [Dyella jejuensis]|uniref:Uncharacterized protein n=1 Tax=Dyella jejuensis TaxID=1432009 RepID=A0ABW8JIN0_9GAMM
MSRQVDPFVLFDHMGSVDFGPGKGMDVSARHPGGARYRMPMKKPIRASFAYC